MTVPTIRLGDVCEKIGSGATPRGGKEVYASTGVTLIRSQNVHNDRFERNGLAFVGPEHARQLENVTVHEGDVLLNITGDSVARVCQAPDDVLPARVNQHVAIIRPRRPDLDPRFLRYYLGASTTQALLLGMAAAGATRNALTKSMIEELRIPVVAHDDQVAIADVLGALDDKIELNRRTSTTLRQIVHSRFALSYSAAAASSWPVTTLADHVEVARGLSYNGKGLADSGIPMHNLNSVYEGGGYKYEGLKRYTGEHKPRHMVVPA